MEPRTKCPFEKSHPYLREGQHLNLSQRKLFIRITLYFGICQPIPNGSLENVLFQQKIITTLLSLLQGSLTHPDRNIMDFPNRITFAQPSFVSPLHYRHTVLKLPNLHQHTLPAHQVSLHGPSRFSSQNCFSILAKAFPYGLQHSIRDFPVQTPIQISLCGSVFLWTHFPHNLDSDILSLRSYWRLN